MKKQNLKETLEKGIKILDEEIEKTTNILNGQIVFKLYDTYGFPVDLTQDYLKNKNIKVDITSFNKEMNEQKQRARKNWKGTGDKEDNKIWFDLVKSIKITEFLGYDKNDSESIITALVLNNEIIKKLNTGDEGVIILNQTPFYGESGGQVGDKGFLINENFSFKVENTTKIF